MWDKIKNKKKVLVLWVNKTAATVKLDIMSFLKRDTIKKIVFYQQTKHRREKFVVRNRKM